MPEEKNTEKESKKGGLGFVGLVIGAIGGAIGGLLFAPKPGKEFREDLKRLYSDVHSEIIERAEQLKKLTRKDYEQVVDEVIEKYKPVLKKTKDELEAWVIQLKEEWPEIAKTIKERAQSVAKTAETSKKPPKKK
jgi:gas vesicle protein